MKPLKGCETKYIVVGDDGESWFEIERCTIYQVTPKQLERLQNGTPPKSLRGKFIPLLQFIKNGAAKIKAAAQIAKVAS